MRWIVGNSLRFPYLVIALAGAITLFGALQLRDSAIDVFPEFAPPRVEIQTPSLGLSAAEVEALVTVPLEESLTGLPHLDIVRSKSVPQLSSIILIFETGADLVEARQLVAERIQTVIPDLPTWASPPSMIQPLSATSRVMKIGLKSDTRSLIDMSMTSYWTIRARLLRVPGVANVPIWGERLQMQVVEVEPERLEANNVSLASVMEVTANALDAGLLRFSDGAVIGTGGFIETPNQRLGIRHIQPIVTPADLARIPLATRGGRTLLLSDVASVIEEHQPLVGDAIIDEGDGLLLIVEKFPWANTLDVTRGVEAAMAELAPGLTGIEVDTTIFRPATFIEMSIQNLTNALILGAILVMGVLALFLFEWRVALISVVAIPTSLVAASLVLHLRGQTINVMVLAGLVIALGAVVDDAIIDVENIVRRLRQHRSQGTGVPMTRVILDASLEVRHAIIYASLIEVLALMPVFFLEGLSGAFFQPLALSYVLAIMASMLVALTVTPALSLVLLRRAPLERRQSPIVPILHRAYERLLSRWIRSPKPAFGLVTIVFVLGIGTAPTLGQELLPSFQERDFLMHWLTRPGTSRPEMNRITLAASEELRQIEGVRNFGAHIGQALLMDEVVGIYFGENWISVDPAVDYRATVDKIQATVDGYPGLFRDVLTYLKERIREVLTGTSEAIVIRISGDDLVELRETAHEIEAALLPIEGLIDLHVDLQVEVPQVEIEVDLEAARAYGIKPGDVRRAAATWVAGEEVGDLFFRGRAYDVVIWSPPDARNSVNALEALPIDTEDGGSVALGEVAEVRLVPTPNVIERENASRHIDVGGNVRDRDLGSVTRDVEAAMAGIALPQGFSAELLGEFTERQTQEQRLFFVALIAMAGIFGLLLLSFGSARPALIGFVTLPAALVGGVLAAFIAGGVISLGSLVGFLTVLGIAARNGIMMINHFQHLEREEGETFGLGLVLRGARERLVPILMTAITTGLAIAPLVVLGDLPGHEIEHPMAVVIMGGLITATLVNLFVVPSLYLRYGRGRGSGADVIEASTPLAQGA